MGNQESTSEPEGCDTSTPVRGPEPAQLQGAWQCLAALSAETVGSMSGMDVSVISELPGFVPYSAVEIGLDATAEPEDLRLVIEIDEVGATSLGTALFGELPTEAMLQDMLREIANTTAGAFVRRASEDQVDLTLGLPRNVPVEVAHAHLAAGQAHHEVSLLTADQRVRLRIQISARRRENVLVRCEELREGMVVAADLTCANGTVLLKRGTRLSTAQAERVLSSLAKSDLVLVADAIA